MNDLFREQLLKAGLATKKQARAAAHEENVGRRKRRKGQGDPDAVEAEAGEAARRALEEKRERDRQLNLEREAEQQRLARHAQSDDLIRQNALRDYSGPVEYKFSDEGVVKRLLVSREVQQRLGRGELGIVWGEKGYYVVPRAAALKLEERTPDRLILLFDPVPEGTPDDCDGAYRVPDDLMW